MAENKDLLEAVLINHHEQNTIVKVINAESKKATSKGDNYTSVMNRVTMDVMLKSGKIKKDSIIIKEMPSTHYSQEMWNVMGLFPKEIAMYRDILPLMEDVLKEFGDHSETMWTKCLHYRLYDRLVFDDLAKYGYTMGNRRKGLDLDHCVLVMRSLAKFHATSVILNQRGLINMNIFKKHVYEDKRTLELMDGFMQDSFNKLTNFMESSWGPEWQPIKNRLKTEIAPNLNYLMPNLMVSDDTKFNVLSHGDCWLNNMLFKYGLDNKTPISIKFVDFQLSFYNSPAFDLKYFLCTSPNMDVRNKSIKTLIEIYHEALLKQLKLYQYEGLIITLDDLNKELDRINLFGLIITLSLLPLILIEDAESMPDVEELMKHAIENTREKLDFNLYEKCTPTYISIIKDTLSKIFS